MVYKVVNVLHERVNARGVRSICSKQSRKHARKHKKRGESLPFPVVSSPLKAISRAIILSPLIEPKTAFVSGSSSFLSRDAAYPLPHQIYPRMDNVNERDNEKHSTALHLTSLFYDVNSPQNMMDEKSYKGHLILCIAVLTVSNYL